MALDFAPHTFDSQFCVKHFIFNSEVLRMSEIIAIAYLEPQQYDVEIVLSTRDDR